ncbi:MAG: SDR family NAD(P)-dependent oxidoreductase [Coprothermobacterota bacterium]|nr:SDR family NAD(P)-dependent oxidoreductase [Coprothermobacterota bacterium]
MSSIDSLQLFNKTAFITGAARGIGKAIANRFAQAGAHLFLVDVNEELLAKTTKEIQQVGATGSIFMQSVDVRHWADVEAAVQRAVKEMGTIDILVNNAGVCKGNRVIELSEEEWDYILDVNLKGVFLCAKAVIREMIRLQTKGRIINLASIMARIGEAATSAYTASKHGVLGFTRCLAYEMAPYGINVNAICPGFVDTDMERDLELELAAKEGKDPTVIREGYESMVPFRRFAQPEDVARLALFLASEDSGYITGQGINVCGGTVMS